VQWLAARERSAAIAAVVGGAAGVSRSAIRSASAHPEPNRAQRRARVAAPWHGLGNLRWTRRMDRPRILLVDGEANARSALREILDEAGYEVAIAASGAEGLSLLESFHPDVLLADVQMREMSGVELERAVRARPRAGPGSPRVLLMSARPPPRDAHGLWLAKPIDIDYLLAMIGRVFATQP
jgi:CheY-like chemotaxis protein